MGLFQEYLDSKGKVRKPKVDISGGDPDPKTPPNKPPKAEKPYVAPAGGKVKGNKGFGDQGCCDKYQPATTKENKGKAPAKIPTAESVELAAFVADVLKKDQSFAESLVNELKREGVLGPVVAEMLQHRATYEYMVEVMNHEEHGPDICTRLSRALNGTSVFAEETAPPFQNRLTSKQTKKTPKK
jgi:hypothetical protein